mgnify:CR=1 FL=1
MLKKINIAVIGATGYTGLDLINLLSKHPKVNIKNLCATKNLGKKIAYFDKRIKKKFPKITSINDIDWKKLDLVFLSLPNGEAQKIIKKTYYKFDKLKYIDLSADFRIKNPKIYKKNYGLNHKANDLIKNSIYSIAEFNKFKIRNFRIVSNPGCYPTSIQIPLVPLIMKKLIKLDNIVIDSKSGYSGAGKNFENKFKNKNLYKSTFAYGIKNHRHVCEIDQEFSKHTNKKVKFTFNPHLLPTFRGILSSIYLNTNKNINSNNIRSTLKKFYRKNRFIKILNINTQIGSGNVLNTNNCEISVCDTRIKGRIVIFSALDNLIKGASGQAVQNMNFLFNFSEKLGLDG